MTPMPAASSAATGVWVEPVSQAPIATAVATTVAHRAGRTSGPWLVQRTLYSHRSPPRCKQTGWWTSALGRPNTLGAASSTPCRFPQNRMSSLSRLTGRNEMVARVSDISSMVQLVTRLYRFVMLLARRYRARGLSSARANTRSTPRMPGSTNASPAL